MSEASPARTPSRVADAVVLGAGIIGAAIARELSVRGAAVTVIESGEPGGGSSGRCDGSVLIQTKHDETGVRLTRQSIEGYRRWIDDLSIDIRFEQPGSLVFFTDEEQMSVGRRRVEWLREIGVKADLIDEDEVRIREPSLDGPLVGGIDCYEDASVYPPFVVSALLSDAVGRGVRLMTRTRALRVLSTPDGRVRGVETDNGIVRAPWVINAMGVWSPKLQVVSGISLPIRPRQGVLLVTEEAPGLIRRSVTEAAYMELRAGDSSDLKASPVFVAGPTFRGNILIGSSRRFLGHTTAVDPELVKAIARRAAYFASALGEVKIIRSFAGLRPWTPDNHPIVGTVDQLTGYVLATGHEGEGIGLAPVTADMVCQIVTGHERDSSLEEAFRLFDPMRLGRSIEREGSL